ncbi:TonB family protein, partial [Spirulina sp. CCNP1310]|uniref:TonB family protein n=1 Tax=Spirulina sp. CCNP1310 TaxID=3110249 RepID=UPI002B20341A
NPPNRATPQDRRIPQFEVADENPNFQLQEFENPAELLPRPRGAEQLARQNPPNPDQAAIIVPPPSPEKAPEEGSTASPSEAIAARREETVLSEIEQRRENLRSNPIDTTAAEAEENNARWLAAAVVEPRALTVAGNYPEDACLRRLSGTTVYGVEVRPDGSRGEPQLLQSAGHKIFNDQARSQLGSVSFPAVNRPTPFRVTVPFTYNPETCPGLAVPTPEPTPTPPRPNTPLPAPPTEEDPR